MWQPGIQVSRYYPTLISIRISNNFQFQFCNQEDEAFVVKKKLSPSQIKRNFNRKSEFEKKKEFEIKDEEFEKKKECEIKDEEFEEKKEFDIKDEEFEKKKVKVEIRIQNPKQKVKQ